MQPVTSRVTSVSHPKRRNPMGPLGKGVLAIWNGIAPEAEEDFVAWHVREHIPERVGLSGAARCADRVDAKSGGAIPRHLANRLRCRQQCRGGRWRNGRGAASVHRAAVPNMRRADGSAHGATARGAGHCRRAPAARSLGSERRSLGREDIARSAGPDR